MTDVQSADFDPFAGPVILATAPSTEPQQEIWTACALGEDASLAFNESITLRLRGSLNHQALGLALSALVLRHEALRTSLSGDGLTLCVGTPFEPELVTQDFRAYSQAAANAALAALAEREVNQPFDLTRGPLFRAHLVRLSVDEHALVFTAHHIVCDGWSTAVLLRDWAALYNANVGSSTPKAALPAAESFSEYARKRSEGAAAEGHASEQYWVKQFTGELPVLELPGDHPRPPRKTYPSRREDTVLDVELVSAVRKAGAKARASLFAVLLAGFKALVFRLTGQDDLVIGIPAAGQASDGHTELVGHCVNMLPLRSALRPNEAFSTLLGRVRKTLLDAQEHQSLTFGALLKKLPIARDPSRLPLVSVIFNVDRGMTSDALGFAGLRAELKANPRAYENFDLFLNAVEIDGRIELECQYNTDLFEAATIARWLESYRLLLADVAANPDTTLQELAVVSAAERLQLSAWNATEAAFSRDACVHELVSARAKQVPAAVACEFADETLTFGDLDARANRLARKLRERGVRRGSLVGLCLERGPELLVGLLGIHKAGGAYVPLDPGYPKERLAFMVEDSAMRVLVTDSTLERELAFDVEQVLCLDRERDSLTTGPAEPLARDDNSAEPESVAYVIYTSGSTGKPKGVLVPHRAVVNLLSSVAKRPGLGDGDSVLALTTLSFDIAVSEIWLPLVVGAKIVMVSRETAADGALLREVCERSAVTLVDATPATYRLLLAAGWRGGDRLTLICTGEAMPKDLAIELPRCAGSVWNGYGPTETTVWSSFWRVPENAARVLIGQPVDNTRIYILDSQKRQVPIGVSGEIYIAGAGVTLGYLNRPDLTQERFIPDPFDPKGALMYRTGDVGRYLSTGNIECLGRNDNQVKLRGFRIELGEIEAVLSQHEAVAEAALILREDRPGDARLVGYIVAHSVGAPSSGELRAHLQRSLPDYMVPATYVILPRMPLTPSGKVDRRALPAPEASADSSFAEFVVPRTETEKILAELWAGALSVARVSIHDDFFALGGHSLLASQILARLRRDHGIELSFRRFFEAPSVARLAELIDGVPATERVAGIAIRPREPGTVVPLSLAQERLWLLEEMHPAQRLVHHLPAAWRLVGELKPELLQQSLDRIAARHETLRTTLKLDGRRPQQQVAEHANLPISLVDLRSMPSEGRESAMFEQIRSLTAEPFDLTRGPLFRSTLFQLAERSYVYFTVRHNVIWDGWSFDVFLQELCTIYDALARGAEPSLPELSVSYGDYALWQREWIKGPELASQVAFWQTRLSGAVPDLSLPSDRPRPSQTQLAGANTSIALSRTDADALTRVARSQGTSLFNLLFAAYSVVLHRFSGQAEIAVGTPVRARNLPEVESLIGPFINAIVLRTTIDPREPFLDYLGRVRDLTLDAFSHQGMPLELLGTRPPIVRAFFSFQDAKTRPLMLGTVAVSQLDVEPSAAANDLMLWLMDRPNELLAVANFSTELFDISTIQRLLRSFVTLLREVSTHPERAVGGLSLLAPEDRVVLETIAAQSPPAPEPWTNEGRLLERTAPEMTAFVASEERLTNAALAARVQAVARAVAQRVPSGGVVGLMLPAPTELSAAALGVLLAGRSVFPLDPRAPEAFSRSLLLAAQPSLLLLSSEAEPSPVVTGYEVLVLRESELDGAGPAAAFPRPEPGSSAWLGAKLGADGTPVFDQTPHASLLEQVKGVAQLLDDSVSALIVWAEPFAESLPLSLLLSAELGVVTHLASSDVAIEAAVAAALQEPGGSTCVVAPTEVWSLLRLSENGARERVTAVVVGLASPELLTKILASFGRVVVVTTAPCPRGLRFAHVVGASSEVNVIGRSLGRLAVSVLDASFGSVPVGVVGQLCVDATEPIATGLFGRLRADGCLEVIPASRAALRSGGLGLLEGVARTLEGHPAVKRAVVRVENEQGGDRNVAYFATHPGVDYTDTELRRHLRALLPVAMVPHVFVELPSPQLDANGAIDVNCLPVPFGTSGGHEYVAPRSESERIVGELYAEALGLAKVSVYDNFFDLGGHSLLCFQVIERIERRVGKRLSPRTLLLSSVEQVAFELGGAPSTAQPELRGSATAPAADASVTGSVFKKLTGLLRR